MEPEGSLPHSQMPATCPYPISYRSSPYPPHPTFWWSILILFSHLRLGLPSISFPQVSPPKPCTRLSSPHTCYMFPLLVFLDFMSRTILGEEYRSFSSFLGSFLYSPVTSSLLGLNTLLNTLISNTLSLRSSLNVSDQVSHLHKKKLPGLKK